MKTKLQDLEKDLLFFYDYLLFLKEIQKEDCWLNYTGVYVNALKLLSDLDMEYPVCREFTKNNYVTKYMELAKIFDIRSFKGEIFALVEVKLYRNQWRYKAV